MEISQATTRPMLFLMRPLSNFSKFCQKSCHETDTLLSACTTINYANNKYLMSIKCIVMWSSLSSCRTNTELSQFKRRTCISSQVRSSGAPPPPRPLLKQIKCSTANIFRKLLSPTNFFVWPKNESTTTLQRNKIYSINTWVNFQGNLWNLQYRRCLKGTRTLLLWRFKPQV